MVHVVCVAVLDHVRRQLGGALPHQRRCRRRRGRRGHQAQPRAQRSKKAATILVERVDRDIVAEVDQRIGQARGVDHTSTRKRRVGVKAD